MKKGEHMNDSRTYRFEVALGWAREGTKITRFAWHEDEFVVLQKGYPNGIGINANTAQATGIPEGTVRSFRPYLMKHTADGSFVPWTPNQEDVLAEDWTEGSGRMFHGPGGLDYREAASLVVNQKFRLSRSAWANSGVYIYATATGAIYKRQADNTRAYYFPPESDSKAVDWFVSSYTPEDEA